MAKINAGDRAEIVKRDQTTEDARQSKYYPFFGGLTGVVQKVYGAEAALQVELDSLPVDLLERHHASEKRMKEKWLAGLSEEARSKLTPEEQDLRLSYTLLVNVSDLVPVKGGKAKAAPPIPTKAEPAPAIETETASAEPKRKKSTPSDEEPDLFAVVERKTSADLDKAEEEFLKKRTKQ